MEYETSAGGKVFMNQLTLVAPSGLGLAHDGAADGKLVELWLSMKTSSHTRRAYAAEAAHFLAFVQKPLSRVTLIDMQAWAVQLGQGTLKPASQNRALTAVKSLLSFAQETGYVPFNVGAAIKLRPNRDGLAQRILEESEVARLIEAAPEGRNRILLKLLYVSGVRVSEACGLKWCDAFARTQGGQITVFGKGGKTRTVLLKPKVWQQLLPSKAKPKRRTPSFPAARADARSMCLKSAGSSTPLPGKPAWRRRSRRTGCATPTPATRSTAARRFTWCRPRSATLPFRPPAGICTRGRPKAPASICRISQLLNASASRVKKKCSHSGHQQCNGSGLRYPSWLDLIGR